MPYSPRNLNACFEMFLINSAIRRLAFDLLDLYGLLRRQPLYPSELQAPAEKKCTPDRHGGQASWRPGSVLF